MNEPKTLDPALAELVEELSNKLLAGEAANLSAYLRAHPEHAEELRRLLPSLRALADVGRSAAEDDAALAPATPQVGRVLGDFRILREVGRGGMGVVYEAVQESLGRHVALKVLPADARLGPHQLERFQREARAAARLHHTNIVPIHGVGEDQGTHYFAMQLIDGQGLDAVLRELRPPEPGAVSAETNPILHGLRSGCFAEATPDPTAEDRAEATSASGKRPGPGGDTEVEYFRSVARIGVQVASALDHAHRQGVLHRDIKPSNLLLSPDGTVWVADFGLAKVEGAAELTGTGDVVGTLRYLAPERFGGVSDARSDIYSLGLTLYELATLRPGFAENDRLRLLDQIHKETPPRPRQVVPAVPRDLETIILKASDKEPARRYQTAGELAEDLRCFLAGEPIRARRLGLLERLGKFVRRNRGPVLAASLVILTLAGGVIGTTIGFFRAEYSRQAEVEQRHLAEANARQAHEAVDRYYTQVSESVLLNEPALEPLRKQLLEDALHYYEGFARQQSGDPETLAEVAAANLRIGNWIHGLALQEDALPTVERATEAVEQLLRTNASIPTSSSLRTGVTRILAYGVPMPHPEEVIRVGTRASAAWEELVRREPAVPGYRNDLATIYMMKATAAHRIREFEAEAADDRRAGQLLAGLVAEHPEIPHYRYGLVMSRVLEAEGLTGLEQIPAAEQAEQQSLELAQGLVAEFPAVTAYKELHRWDINLIAYHREMRGRFPEAESWYRQELEINEGLLERYPTVPRYRVNVLNSSCSVADVLWAQGRQEEAGKAYRSAVAVATAGGDETPDLLMGLAWLLATCPDSHVRDPGRAATLATRWVEQAPEDQDALRLLGAAQYALGDYQSAARTLTKAAATPGSGLWGEELKLTQALAHGRLGERERARACYDEALALLNKSQWWTAEVRRLCAEAEQVLGLPPHQDQATRH
jgi:serine/threonine protein kinase